MIPLLFHLGRQDAARLTALHADAYDDPWSAPAFREVLSAKTGFGFGLEQGDDLIAFVLVQIAGEDADILQIATRPDCRRKGLARQLLTALETRMRMDGVTRLTLDVAADNPAARAFYRAADFAEDGVRPRYYTARRTVPADAILMSKTL